MWRALNRWPPLVWLLVYVGSVLVLMGSQRSDFLGVGLALILVALGVAVHLAVRAEPRRPRPTIVAAALGGVAAWYVVAAIAAAPLGPDYALAALLAGAIPMTATALWLATARRMTVEEDGALRSDPAEENGPLPAIGMDDATPLGDTPEAHDEISPHDLPLSHPGRHATERQADRARGTTRGR
jgi:hypothetical protein